MKSFARGIHASSVEEEGVPDLIGASLTASYVGVRVPSSVTQFDRIRNENAGG